MTRREIVWEMLIRQHPEYLERPPRFTPRGLRQFFDWVWDIAERDWMNREVDKPCEDTNRCKAYSGNADLDFLKTLMGMGDKR